MSRRALAAAAMLIATLLPSAAPAFDFATMDLPTDEARSLVFAPDGRGLYIGDPAGNVRFWDFGTGEVSVRVPGALTEGEHSALRNVVRLLPDGRTALVAYDSGVIRHVDLESGKEIWSVRPFVTQLLSLAVSPDGRRAVTTDLTGRVLFLDVADGSVVWDFKHAAMVNDTAFSASGEFIFEAELGRFRVETLEGYLGPFDFQMPSSGYSGVDRIDVSKTGVVAGADGDAVHLFDGKTGKRLRSVELDGEFSGRVVAISPDGKRFLTDYDEGEFGLYEVKSGKRLGVLGAKAESHDIAALAFSPDGRLFAAADTWGGITLWRGKGLKQVAGARIWSDGWAAFTPNGAFMGEYGEMETLLSLDGFDPSKAEPDTVKAALADR